MERRIIFGLTAAVLVAAGVGVALIEFRSTPSGRLDTNLSGVSVEQLRPPLTGAKHVQRKTTARPAEGPCWLTFGGDPARSLARTQLVLGRPTKALWVHALDGYIEFPPSYCDGRLYVNTYRGTTYAVDSETGDILWRWRGGGHKPSATAIDGPRLLVASTAGTLTALNRRTGRPIWRLRTSAWISVARCGRTHGLLRVSGRPHVRRRRSHGPGEVGVRHRGPHQREPVGVPQPGLYHDVFRTRSSAFAGATATSSGARM